MGRGLDPEPNQVKCLLKQNNKKTLWANLAFPLEKKMAFILWLEKLR